MCGGELERVPFRRPTDFRYPMLLMALSARDAVGLLIGLFWVTRDDQIFPSLENERYSSIIFWLGRLMWQTGFIFLGIRNKLWVRVFHAALQYGFIG